MKLGNFPSLQSKILQLVQDHSFIPIGASKEVVIDFRIIAATNRDLKECVQKETFRNDLYYRLETIKIEISSLRNRQEDIPCLIDYFMEKYNNKYKTGVYISPVVIEHLKIRMAGIFVN